MRCHMELKWEKFGLSPRRPTQFGTSQWQNAESVSVAFLLYRLAVFLYFGGFFIWDLIADYQTPGLRAYYLVYLTNWTYLTAMSDICVQLASAAVAAYRLRKGVKPVVPRGLCMLHWFTVNVSHTAEPFVTLMYWCGVFPFLDRSVTYSDLHLHLLTTLYTLVDLCVHATPRRLYHAVFPLGFGIAYILFTVVYYLCGGLSPNGATGIYPILDWARPGMTLGVTAGSVLVIAVLHAATWALVGRRVSLHRRRVGRRVSSAVGASSGGEASHTSVATIDASATSATGR